MDEFFIRPAVDGARLDDPATGDLLAAAGERKPRSPHWLRLEIRGDVVQCEPPIAPAEDEAEPLKAVHRGGGSYSVMRGDAELVEHLTKADAETFNALDDAEKTAFVTDRAPA